MASILSVTLNKLGCKLIEAREDGTVVHHPISAAVAAALINGGVHNGSEKATKRARLAAPLGIVEKKNAAE
jgi:hypothetical protein